MYCVSHKTVLVLADNMNIGKQMLGCVDIFKLNTFLNKNHLLQYRYANYFKYHFGNVNIGNKRATLNLERVIHIIMFV